MKLDLIKRHIYSDLKRVFNFYFWFEICRNKVLIAKAGAIPVILKILQWQNECYMELAVAALLILSSCSQNKLEIASSGAIQLLVELLNSELSLSQSISNQAKFDIISTLHNLSTSPQIIPLIVVSGGLMTMIRLIYASDKSTELVEKAMALLESLVSSSQVALTQVLNHSFFLFLTIKSRVKIKIRSKFMYFQAIKPTC